MRAQRLLAKRTTVKSLLKARGSPQSHGLCKLRPYTKINVPAFKHTGEVIAYASPDSTYAVSRQLLASAKHSICIGIYDFTASYMHDLLIDAMQRGVVIELLLDVSGTDETRIFDDLVRLGCSGLRAPSCANRSARFFTVVHQKVIVIDDTWVQVQSGNYTPNSIPKNESATAEANFKTGNRDTGLAFRSPKLAAFFKKRLAGDRKLVIDAKIAPKAIAMLKALKARETLFVPAPKKKPTMVFASKRFTLTALKVHPVLTPDNYLDAVAPWLESAKKSIHIEEQYIWAWQSKVQILIQAMKRALAAYPKLEIRIVLGKAFAAEDVKQFDKALARLDQDLGLKRTRDIRFINQDMFVHCHNKMILIDGQSALVSSQNWSDTAVDTNREAGVIVDDRRITRYFEQIFAFDWRVGVSSPLKAKPKFLSPKAFTTGKVVRLDPGDVTFV